MLESRHVIGLFMLMLLFSGIFFTLGFLMGRDRYDGAVRAEGVNPKENAAPAILPKSAGKRGSRAAAPAAPAAETPKVDTTASGEPAAASEWDFYNAGKSGEPDDRLKPASNGTSGGAAGNARTIPGSGAGAGAAKNNGAAAKPESVAVAAKPAKAGGAAGLYTLQVAALKKGPDATHLARTLKSKNFPAFVVSPQADKYYRVQVGPYADQKAAEAARKKLEGAGFKAIVKH